MNGYVYAQNMATGAYLQIEDVLSEVPVPVYPYYAKMDNGKKAYYMNANAQRDRCFNVGIQDGDSGPVNFFAGNADRVRLRWVIEESTTEYEAAIIGDANNDGKIDNSDVGVLVSMILYKTPENLARGDINKDGNISLSDVTSLVTRIYTAK